MLKNSCPAEDVIIEYIKGSENCDTGPLDLSKMVAHGPRSHIRLSNFFNEELTLNGGVILVPGCVLLLSIIMMYGCIVECACDVRGKFGSIRNWLRKNNSSIINELNNYINRKANNLTAIQLKLH